MEIMNNIDFTKYMIVLIGYLFTILTSGFVVGLIMRSQKMKEIDPSQSVIIDINLGRIIGKCENILAITLILSNAVTGLALIFTAKTIIRSDDIRRDSRYYLGGTIVNLTYSVLMAYLIRIVLGIINHPI